MKFPSPPRGLASLPWRFPIWIYRLGLGAFLGEKFLLLTHQGRKSGKLRQTVLEIIQSKPGAAEYFVVSGFGKHSDWYQNILSNPSVKIQVGSRKMSAVARQLSPDQASQAILSYAQRYPKNLKTLSALLGYEIEHTQAGYLAFGREIPVICFSTTAQQH